MMFFQGMVGDMANTYDSDVTPAKGYETIDPTIHSGGLQVAPEGTIAGVDTSNLPKSKLSDKPTK
jgi:hypothetical protein